MDRGDLLFLVVALLFFLVITTLSSLFFIAAYVPAVREWLDTFWELLIKRRASSGSPALRATWRRPGAIPPGHAPRRSLESSVESAGDDADARGAAPQ